MLPTLAVGVVGVWVDIASVIGRGVIGIVIEGVVGALLVLLLSASGVRVSMVRVNVALCAGAPVSAVSLLLELICGGGAYVVVEATIFSEFGLKPDGFFGECVEGCVSEGSDLVVKYTVVVL